jgi:hypothetical protein
LTYNTNNTLRNVYNLDYDSGVHKSGLTSWYNKLVDKKADELDAIDVAKMMRQNILRNVALDSAVTLFLRNPFDGETRDGEILALLASADSTMLEKTGGFADALRLIPQLESTYKDYDWGAESDRDFFKLNLAVLKKKADNLDAVGGY